MTDIQLARKALKRVRIRCDGFKKGLIEVIKNGWNPQNNLEILNQMTDAMKMFIDCYDDVIILHDNEDDEKKDIDAKDKAMAENLRIINMFKEYRDKFNKYNNNNDSINKKKIVVNIQDKINNETVLYGKHSCIKCHKSFESKSVMMAHEKRVHDDTEFDCTLCKKVVVGRMKFNQHLAVHKSAECKYCGLWMKVNSKRTHEIKCSPENSLLNCDKCDYTSHQNSNLKRHMKTQHSSNFNCNECKQSFRLNKQLNKHLEHAHLTTTEANEVKADNIYKCLLCGKGFNVKSNLNRHIKVIHASKKVENSIGFGVFEDQVVHNKPAKAIGCDRCEYKSTKLAKLKKHMKTCNVLLSCDKCDYTSKKPYNLKRHMNTCNEDTASNVTLSCNNCDYQSKKTFCLKRHIKTCNAKANKTPVNKRHKWRKCKERLERKKMRNENFICKFCGKDFKNNGSIKAHERNHETNPPKESEKPLQCDICQNFFKTKEFLDSHLKNHFEFEQEYEKMCHK